MTRLLFVLGDPGFFLSHRAPIALAARAAGYDVQVATPPGGAVAGIEALGLPHHPLPLQRGGTSLAADLGAALALLRLFRRLRPDVVHLVTAKPVIWGGLAARLAGVPGRVAALSGLGHVFIAQGWRAALLRRLVATLTRVALGGRGVRVILQNTDDRDMLAGLGLHLGHRLRLIRGSGVDLAAITPAPEPDGPPVVLMPARLLLDKGAAEFVAAARILQDRGVAARFVHIGDPDPRNPACVPPDLAGTWAAEGAVEFRGHRTDIAAQLAQAHIVALPSYREGLPKALIEAAAAGRAVVTTDAPGCRDAITPGVTGLMVPVRDAAALAEAIASLIADPARRRAMGAAGRALAEAAFDIDAVVAAHLAIYAELSG